VLTVGSLFSGIGGLDLGLERAGMNVIWQSEIDPYACKVLSKHWPAVVNHGDIKTINWGDIVRPEVICGGYPCQPFSQAGKRRGEDDPRHLWPWVREAISELQPRYAILENVRGHLSMGGLTVIGELANIGYDAEWRVISAASVGANHRRDRVIIVAYPTKLQRNGGNNHASIGSQPETISKPGNCSRASHLAYASSERCMDTFSTVFPTNGRFPTFAQPTERSWWTTEPDVGRVANGVPSRVDRLRGLGNAVVPQVAELIGRMVIDYDTNL
jgi:DNA (cytosine-5)-methyltransferase 1